MTRAEAVHEIGTLLDNRCANCPTKANLLKIHGCAFSHVDTYCNRKCTVGQRLQDLGRHLKLGPRKTIIESEEESA